jgi:hypothetical protein
MAKSERVQVWWCKVLAFCDRYPSGEVAAREARLGNPWPLLERFQSGRRLTRDERRVIEQLLAESCGRRGGAFNEDLKGICARGYVEMVLAEGKSKKAAVAQLESKYDISRRSVYNLLGRARSE